MLGKMTSSSKTDQTTNQIENKRIPKLPDPETIYKKLMSKEELSIIHAQSNTFALPSTKTATVPCQIDGPFMEEICRLLHEFSAKKTIHLLGKDIVQKLVQSNEHGHKCIIYMDPLTTEQAISANISKLKNTILADQNSPEEIRSDKHEVWIGGFHHLTQMNRTFAFNLFHFLLQRLNEFFVYFQNVNIIIVGPLKLVTPSKAKGNPYDKTLEYFKDFIQTIKLNTLGHLEENKRMIKYVNIQNIQNLVFDKLDHNKLCKKDHMDTMITSTTTYFNTLVARTIMVNIMQQERKNSREPVEELHPEVILHDIMDKRYE